jgi:UDP-N-acetylmuramoylalanine--D-glutamate ligase
MADKEFKMQKYPFSIEHEIKNGAYLNQNKLMINLSNSDQFDITISDLAIQGKHNLYNSMASGISAKILDIRNETIRESMGSYKNIPHRIEFVANISGISFINDSKATNVNSVWYALESIKTDVILIMGGVDKGNDYTMLKSLVKEKVKAIICLGKDNKALHDAFEDDVEIMVNTFSASEAVQIAYHMAKKGSTVILSPACSSFDLFKNYEDRGDQFKAAVKEL